MYVNVGQMWGTGSQYWGKGWSGECGEASFFSYSLHFAATDEVPPLV